MGMNVPNATAAAPVQQAAKPAETAPVEEKKPEQIPDGTKKLVTAGVCLAALAGGGLLLAKAMKGKTVKISDIDFNNGAAKLKNGKAFTGTVNVDPKTIKLKDGKEITQCVTMKYKNGILQSSEIIKHEGAKADGKVIGKITKNYTDGAVSSISDAIMDGDKVTKTTTKAISKTTKDGVTTRTTAIKVDDKDAGKTVTTSMEGEATFMRYEAGKDTPIEINRYKKLNENAEYVQLNKVTDEGIQTQDRAIVRNSFASDSEAKMSKDDASKKMKEYAQKIEDNKVLEQKLKDVPSITEFTTDSTGTIILGKDGKPYTGKAKCYDTEGFITEVEYKDGLVVHTPPPAPTT